MARKLIRTLERPTDGDFVVVWSNEHGAWCDKYRVNLGSLEYMDNEWYEWHHIELEHVGWTHENTFDVQYFIAVEED